MRDGDEQENGAIKTAEEQVRLGILQQLEDWLEIPMVILGLVWLVLLVLEFTGVTGRWLGVTTQLIWGIFWVDFLVKLSLAPHKWTYLKRNWLTLLALLVPALRILRVVRAIRLLRVVSAARTLRFVRVLSSLNRGMRALGATMRRRGFGYVLTLTFIVAFVGAAGMLAFENQNPDGRNLEDYGTALWWTAMIMTTMGSEFWPQTVEGRLLCLILAVYAFAVFGYVTATLASYFIDRDAENKAASAPEAASLERLHADIAALRREMQAVAEACRRKP